MEVRHQNLKSIITSIELTSKETLEGQMLTTLQSACIVNLRGTIAEEILTLTYEPKEPEVYGVKLAYLQGQLDILTHLLTLSVDTTNELYNPNYQPEGDL